MHHDLTTFNNFVAKEILNKLKIEYETLDNQLFYKLRENRENKHFVVKDRIKRKIIFPFGSIVIKRRRYLNIKTNQYFYLLDNELKLIRKTCYSNIFLETIRNEILANNFTIEKIRNQYVHKISRVQFKTLLNRIVNNLTNQNKTELDPKLKLYINIDDTYLYFKIKNKARKHRIRLFVFHQGKDKFNKFINLKYHALIKPVNSSNSNQNEIELNAVKDYLFSNQPKQQIICSDGAREFCILAKKIKSKHYLDKWHLLYSKFFRIFNPRKKEYDGTHRVVRQGIYEELVNLSKNDPDSLLERIIYWKNVFFTTDIKSKIAHALMKVVSYVKNNLSGIKYWKSKDYFTPLTEAYVFYKIKKILGDKHKCFSLNTFFNFLKIKENYEN